MRGLSWRDKKVDVQPCNFLNFFGKILWKFERPFQNYFEKLLFITILEIFQRTERESIVS